jgi:hypothetical protein
MQVVLGLVLLAIAYVGLFVMVEKIGRMAIKHTAPYTAAIIVASLAIGWAGWGFVLDNSFEGFMASIGSLFLTVPMLIAQRRS